MVLGDDEKIEDLQFQNLKIIQNKKLYNFTSDSVVLANFVKTRKSDVAVEIGAGCGVISILVQAKNPLEHVFAFELQNEMVALCEKNIALNRLENKITLFHDRVQNFEDYIKKSSADVVFSNPPYFKSTNFEQDEVKRIAKEESFLPLKDLVFCAAKMLKSGGAFYCCYNADRSIDLICECRKNKLEVKEMFFTENGQGKVKIVVIKAVKDGKSGVKVFKNLITNNQNGDYLEELKTKYLKKN